MTERKALILSAATCLVIAGVGLTVAALSSSQAVMLDGLFNLTYFATGLFTLKVARLVQRGDDERFPYGYAFFEPLVNGIKGLLVLGISTMALVDAVLAILSGGRTISAGLAIAYGVFASLVCWTVAVVMRISARRSGSPLVRADAENWLVNGAVSSAVLLAFLGILLIRDTRFDFLVPYIDPGVVLTVVLVSIPVPARMSWRALMEILNRTPPPEVTEQVRAIIGRCTADLPVRDLFVRVIQPGRTRMVAVHVVLPADYELARLEHMDELRRETLEALEEAHLATALDMIFTADRSLGAPASRGDDATQN